TSTSSPVDCVTDDVVSFTIKYENIDFDDIEKQEFTYDGINYNPITCTKAGNLLQCSHSADELCGEMKNVLTVIFSFTDANNTYYTNPQKVYFKIPEPHMQVYSIQPNTLSIGEKNSVTVNLYVQYPKMVGESPIFLYSYLDKTNQKMSCNKVSSTSIRDFYDCANTDFEVPADYSKSQLPVLFSIQGTTISFPMNIPVETLVKTTPWLEIVSTTPSRIEILLGNQTSASFYVTVHNAAEKELKHQATLIPNSWITSGSCKEEAIEYDFTCDVTIKPPTTAKTGPNSVTLSLKVSNSKTYDISNQTTVYVLPEETLVEIQSISPNTLYCEGHKQQNPNTVKVTATSKNLVDFELVEEDISFNDLPISHTARYCTSQRQSITCEIPTDRFFEKVTCGEGELAPGEGSRYYPLTLTFLVESGGELITISGSKDVSIVARPLEPYLEIADNDVVDRVLQTPINCLGSQTIKLGDTGYVRIMYADLLHPEPKEDDVRWSFRLDAHDDKGKLTSGMGVSPEENATICKFISHQRMGVHRIEDYECSLYLTNKMFQRCANGEGELLITATSGGKKAEGRIKTTIVRDDSKYQIEMEIVSEPMKEIDCQIQSYGEKAPCSFASYSNQNVTIRIYNRNQEVELTDL
ncbi:MAG: hypothetical protein GTN39_06255, partial [Candidatus Aenigmarchaeota archaeon]|nr:hypothetical protein [Candidatus Aenigmarchaeota archaeon]